MYQLVPEPTFSVWFETLRESLAEELAGVLEVLAKGGGVLEPSQVSRALLWFDGTRDPAFELALGRWHAFVVSHSAEALRGLLSWQREIVLCLESEAFASRLTRLSPERASQALLLVAALKERLGAWQREIWLELAARKSPAHPLELQKSELAHAFREVLRAVGLPEERLVSSESGLRELTLTTTAPKVRVLFGLDAEREALILILGEELRRTYYGDSVRLAEAAWARYGKTRASASSRAGV